MHPDTEKLNSPEEQNFFQIIVEKSKKFVEPVRKRIAFTQEELWTIIPGVPSENLKESKQQRREIELLVQSADEEKREFLKSILYAYDALSTSRRINMFNIVTDIIDLPVVATQNPYLMLYVALSLGISGISAIHKLKSVNPKIRTVQKQIDDILPGNTGKLSTVTNYENWSDLIETSLEALSLGYVPARFGNMLVLLNLWTDAGYRIQAYDMQKQLYSLAKQFENIDIERKLVKIDGEVD